MNKTSQGTFAALRGIVEARNKLNENDVPSGSIKLVHAGGPDGEMCHHYHIEGETVEAFKERIDACAGNLNEAPESEWGRTDFEVAAQLVDNMLADVTTTTNRKERRRLMAKGRRRLRRERKRNG